MKILRYALIAIGGILLLFIAVIAYVAATFDPNEYKPQIVQAVKDRTQRDLRLEGDIKLVLFPSIGARLGKAALSEPGSDRQFAAVEDLRVAVKVMPLLSRQVVVDAVEIKGLRANLVRFKDGKSNFDDLMVAGPAPAPKKPDTPLAIDIAHVLIEDAAVTFTDQRAGTKYALSRFNLKTGRVASGVPTNIELSLQAQSDKPKLSIETALKTRLTFDLDRERYALEGLDLNAKGDAAGFGGLAVSAKGNVDARPAAREFAASKLALAVSGRQNGADVSVKVDLPRLNLTKERVSSDRISIDAAMSQAKKKGRLAAKVEVAALEGDAQAFKAGQLTASADVQHEGATMKVKLSSPVAASLARERFELPKLAATINVSRPRLPKSPFDATLTGAVAVDLAKQTADLKFATKLDESNISGRAGLARFAPPVYTFDIDVDQLDADRYLPKADPKAKPDPKAKQPEQPFDLAALKDLNASGSIRIGSLKAANVKASKVRLDVKAAKGRLDVNPLSANLYEGSLAGALAVSAAAPPAFAVKQNLSGINIGPLLRDLAENDMLEGRGNVTLDVTARGNTVSALKKALNGTAAVKLSDGAVKGIDIAGTIRSAKAKLGTLRGEQVQQADVKQQTDFSALSATFNIRDGVARNKDLSIMSPLLRIGGEGAVNIGEDSLDYLLRASIVATTRGQAGRELDELKGVTVPVRVAGPLASPSYRLDFTALATEAVREKVEQTVRDRIKERLGGAAAGDDATKQGVDPVKSLRGLFGR
jgi:AsmA protein